MHSIQLHDWCVGVVVERGYQEHFELIGKLSPVNHSDDDSECELEGKQLRSRHKRFRIIRCEWMSDALRNFLRFLYEAHMTDWETSPEKRQAGGSNPRDRYERVPPDSTVGVPAVGLWQNCYNPAWLKTLQRHEVRQLHIIKKNYCFKINDEDDSDKQPEFVQGSSKL
ncbi:hypothetical protein C8Q80DRAFT_1107940 [Daedaleopsis nitida]|nr:hypothetical protein C8Q80DRAFT_1107940 [Daedaleopsis nitida]